MMSPGVVESPTIGMLSGDPGRSPADASTSSSSATSGTSARASRSSSYTAPAVTAVQKPPSSTVPPITTRPSPRGRMYTEPPRMVRAIISGDPRRRRICPFTGRTGGVASLGTPGTAPDQGPAASTTDAASIRCPPSSATPVARPASTSSEALDLWIWTPRRLQAWSSVGIMARGSTWWSESTSIPPRLEVTCLARAEPFHRKPELLAETVVALQSALLVGIDGDVQRSGLAVACRAARVELELGDKRWISRRGITVEGDHRLLAELGLSNRRDHPRSKVGGARSRFGIDDGHVEARASGPPGHGETDDTSADDHCVHVFPPLLASSLRGRLDRADSVQAVADAEDRGDPEGDLGEWLELLAEPAHVDVHRLGVAVEAISPHSRDDRLT